MSFLRGMKKQMEGNRMKKYYIAEETGRNKWVKHTGWKLEKKDVSTLFITLLVVVYVAIRIVV